jgi:stage II sporulation protein D
MDRGQFLASLITAPGAFELWTQRRIRAALQSSPGDADPAMLSTAPALRVLLGNGDAQPIDATTFSYAGRRFRGSFVRLPDGGIVTTVPVEQYLYSVVAREMPASWPDAALQAQAICARTYVLQRSNPSRDYDVVSSESDQVYDGLDSESPAAIGAVNASSRQVLRFAGGFAAIAYSSSCGGHTESSVEAWGGEARPYLNGVVCGWCSGSPDYHWSCTIAAGDVARSVSQSFIPDGELQDVRVTQADSSGRAKEIEIVAAGSQFSVEAAAFRRAVGTRLVRSLLIRSIVPGPTPQTFVVSGGGLGHGVGLCQWGAKGMALAGKSAAQIVSWYFPGTQLGND